MSPFGCCLAFGFPGCDDDAALQARRSQHAPSRAHHPGRPRSAESAGPKVVGLPAIASRNRLRSICALSPSCTNWYTTLPRVEWLKDYATLAVWAEFTGLVESAEPLRALAGSAAAAGVLGGVRSLRAALYRVLRRGDSDAFAEVAARAEEANALRRLGTGAHGSAEFRLPAAADVRLPLHAAALAGADLLSSKETTVVRACPGHGCGWLFLDPRGRRIWCSMATCGNRAKARAHAARHRET